MKERELLTAFAKRIAQVFGVPAALIVISPNDGRSFAIAGYVPHPDVAREMLTAALAGFEGAANDGESMWPAEPPTGKPS